MIWIIAYIALVSIGLGIHATRHGEGRTDCYNFWTALFSSALTLFILYKGNFFNPLFG